MSEPNFKNTPPIIKGQHSENEREAIDALERARRVGYSECLLDIQAFIEESGADYMQALEEVKKDFRKKFNE